MIKYIVECMDSVCNQTFQDIEILSIDAGSEDGTLEILREFEKKDSRVNVILSEQKSYGYQVNKGISMARGEYIAIIETDDVVEPEMLKILYKCAKQYDLDYVKGDFCALVAFDDGIVWKKRMRIYPRSQDIYDKVINPSADVNAFLQDVYLWRGIYKRSFLINNEIVLNESKGAAFQDVGFLMQTIGHAQRAMYISDIVYNYRQNNAGSSVYNSNAYSFLLGEYPFIRQRLEKANLFQDEFRECYYTRMFVQIITRYRTMAASGILWKNTQKERQELWEKIKFAYNDGYFNEYILGKSLWYELQQYMNSEESYWRYQLCLYNAKRRVLNELMNRAKRVKKIVFYSKSVIGGFVYCLLKNAGVDVPVCFCDNDIQKQGTTYMNAPVLSVEEASFNNSDTLYIIANRKIDQNMSQQLMDLGVEKSKIYVWMLDTDILMLNMAQRECFLDNNSC